MAACISTFRAPCSSFTAIGRRELIVNDLRLTTYFCSRKIVEVMTTMIAAIAAAKFA